ncbi:hypothetical protein N0V93_002612 [Gnomoniopsis smithogilvyi]|uniref:Amidoligase enzyme n=1 Tax=Gnomoniopsis smithogilvyi TaxID=1191159 RepID=A0A9W9CZ55_9PEZI|nr:hypothetical protein N0V93_002612 [Gnomoniopsis smithogilvyi]
MLSSHPPADPSYAVRDTPEDITFAVELKFILRQDLKHVFSEYGIVREFIPHRPVELRDSMTEPEIRLQRDNWEAVARAIDALSGVNAAASHEHQAQRRDFWKTHWMVYKANSACPPYMTYFQDDPDRPVLDSDDPEWKKFVWTPVEICSPILYWTQKAEALDTLTRVIAAVNKQFDIVANASTECHVHVGRSDGRFYSLKTLKRLATLLWLSEPLLRALKDPTSPNYDHHYTWSYPWRENSRIAMALNRTLPDQRIIDDLYSGKANDFDAFLLSLSEARITCDDENYTVLEEHCQALRAIWRASDHHELGQMLRGPDQKHRRLGFNFHALEADAAGESIPRTIEFRFLEGFFDGKIVPAWVRLCAELIDISTEKDAESVENDWDFYDAVALLLKLPQEWPLDAQFSAFMDELGQDRVPQRVRDPLEAIIRKHYPSQNINLENTVQ